MDLKRCCACTTLIWSYDDADDDDDDDDASLSGLVLSSIACFILLVIAPLAVCQRVSDDGRSSAAFCRLKATQNTSIIGRSLRKIAGTGRQIGTAAALTCRYAPRETHGKVDAYSLPDCVGSAPCV